jgi:hypothetical protein
MAKRSDRGSVKLMRCSGKPCAKPDAEMSADLANHHQGQQPALPVLHQKAGYKTAVNPPRQHFQILLAIREASI